LLGFDGNGGYKSEEERQACTSQETCEEKPFPSYNVVTGHDIEDQPKDQENKDEQQQVVERFGDKEFQGMI
jgi:hypothetical protein